MKPDEKVLADAMLWSSVYYDDADPGALIVRILGKLKEDGWMLVPRNRYAECGVTDNGEIEFRSADGKPLVSFYLSP